MSIKLSIIVPVYNIEKYLKRCIDSILSQTFSDFELILVDDGSTDGSLAICRNYEKIDSRIIVIHQENSGVSVARNNALKVAKGDWLGFVDGDDWIEPETYQKGLEKAEQMNADIVQWNFIYEDNKRNRISNEIPEGYMSFNSEKDYPWWIAVVWNKIFKRNLIFDNGIFFPKGIAVSEDTQFSFLAYAYSNIVYMMTDVFYHYFIREDSAINTMTVKKIENKIQAIANIESCLKNTGKLEIFDSILKTKRINAKNSYILGLKNPDFKKWRDIYPELTKDIIKNSSRKSAIIFKLAYYRIYVLAVILCKIRRI